MGCNQAELQHREESRAPPSARPSTHGTASRARPTQEQARTAKPQTPTQTTNHTRDGRAGRQKADAQGARKRGRAQSHRPSRRPTDGHNRHTTQKGPSVIPSHRMRPNRASHQAYLPPGSPPNPLRCAAAPQPQPPRTRRRGRSPRDEQERLACPLAGRQRVRTAHRRSSRHKRRSADVRRASLR